MTKSDQCSVAADEQFRIDLKIKKPKNKSYDTTNFLYNNARHISY